MNFTNRRLLLISVISISIETSEYAVFCYLHDFPLNGRLFDLYSLVYFILAVSWLVTDPALPPAHKPSFDHVMLIWLTFPVFACCQMYAAHKWRGIAMVLGLSITFLVPGIVLSIAWMLER